MGARHLIATFVLFVVLAACSPKPSPEPNPPDPEPPTATCSLACERLRALGCDEGADTPDGAPCEDVCQYAGMAGVYDLACVAELDACAIDSCARP